MYQHLGRATILDPKVTVYRTQVGAIIMRLRADGVLGREPLTGRLAVRMLVYEPADGRRRDLDNLWKCVLDACTKTRLWEDDSLIDHAANHRMKAKTGCITLNIEPANPCADEDIESLGANPNLTPF
jgi:Holliday junction resolvase RusA-like endonuclease